MSFLDLPAKAVVERELNDPNSPASAALSATYGTNSVLAVAEKFAGIDPTGAANSSAGIQAAINAVPDGGTVIIPAGTYNIATALTSTGKNFTLKAYGATFIKTANVTAFDFKGTYGTPIPVTSLGVATVTDDTSGSDKGVAINVGAAPTGWVKGDIVKVYADDVIPDGKPGGGGGTESRVGGFLVVSNVTGNTINCIGSLTDPFTTNIRVAKLNNTAVHVRGGRYITDPAGLTGLWASNMFNFRSMQGPTVREAVIESTSYAGFQFTGCYGYTVDSCDVGYAKNDSANGINGYGISDRSCSFGRVSNYRARRVRHAFTDGSPEIVANTTDPANYGRTYGAAISNSSAHGTANAAWDTHSWSESTTFSNVHAYDSFRGFDLRGRNHRINNCSAVRCDFGGVYIANEADGGNTFGHSVNGFLAEECGRRSIEANINQTGYLNAGVRETRKSYLSNILIKGAPAPDSMYFVNATVRLDNVVIMAGPAVANDDRIVYVHNSDVDGKNWTIDTSKTLSTITGLVMVYLRDASVLKIDGQLDYIGTAASNAISYGLRFLDTASKAVINNMRSNKVLGVAYNTASFDSVIDWEDMANGQNSAWISESDSAISSTTETGAAAKLGRTRARKVVMRLAANGGAQTLAPLPTGLVRGQELIVWNISTSNSVTVSHGTSAKTTLTGSVAKALAPQERITLMWQNSSWWQIA